MPGRFLLQRGLVAVVVCSMGVALPGCDSAARQFDAARAANTEKALSEFLATHKGHKLANDAKPILESIIQAKTYHWSPSGPLAKEGANDFEIIQKNNHTLTAKATSNSSHAPGTMPLGASPANITFYFEGLGSKNIRIQPNKELGYTTYAGLRFENEAVVAIRDDGAITVDREGVTARDEKGRPFISRKVVVDGTFSILMLEPL